MYRKSIRTKRLEAKRKRCAAMRVAKERKRMAFGATMLDVGGWMWCLTSDSTGSLSVFGIKNERIRIRH